MTITALKAAPGTRLDTPASALSAPGPALAQADTPLAPARSVTAAPRALAVAPQSHGVAALSKADQARVSAAVSRAKALHDGASAPDIALRDSLDALQREWPELYQRALDRIVADFYASPNRAAYAQALLMSTSGPCGIAGDIYARIGPQGDLHEGQALTGAELAAIGAGLASHDLEGLPHFTIRDIASALELEATAPKAAPATVDAAMHARVSLLRTCPPGSTNEADEAALADDLRFAFGEPRTAVERAVPDSTRAELQQTMQARIEALLGSGQADAAAQVEEALTRADAAGMSDASPLLQSLRERTVAMREAEARVSTLSPVSVRDTPEVSLPWLADGLDVFLHSDVSAMATHLIADTPDIPAPMAATFRAGLEKALRANIEVGDDASRTISLDTRDANGDHRVYTYDLQRYRSPKKHGGSSDPHLHAAGLRFASEAGRARLAAITTRDDAVAYANQVIDTVARERVADDYMPLTDSQRVAIRDGIVGWLNLAAHHGMPVSPVLRVIDEAQRVTSLNRAININLETGREQKIWANGNTARLSGLTSSTLRGDLDGDGHMDFFSNILNRRAFELGFFNLHLYRGKHGRTLQQDGVNPRFQSQWDPQLAAMHVASYVRRGPPVVSGRSNMCDAIEDNAASRSAIVDFDGAMVFRHSLSNNARVAKRWRPNVKRQDYTGQIWHSHDEALGWGPIPGYTPVPKSIYPDLVLQAMKS